MGKRPAQVTPYPRLMTQILRLAVARVESGENAEDLGGSLRTHEGIERDELAEIETTLGDAPALRVAAEQIILDHLRHLHPGILQQRHHIIGGRPHQSVLEIQNTDARRTL